MVHKVQIFISRLFHEKQWMINFQIICFFFIIDLSGQDKSKSPPFDSTTSSPEVLLEAALQNDQNNINLHIDQTSDNSEKDFCNYKSLLVYILIVINFSISFFNSIR
jgi:hypothetical protein